MLYKFIIFSKHTWKNLVWYLVNAHPILRSSSCLASTDMASFLLGEASELNARFISESVMALNLARNTVWNEKLYHADNDIQYM